MKISEIFGKVLVNTDGGVCGYVRGACACGERIQYLTCADGEEREFEVDFRDVAFTDGRLIFTGSRQLKNKSVSIRLGLPAYTEDGRFCGYVRDIVVEKGEIKHYFIGRKKYPFGSLNVGDAVIIRGHRILKEDVVKDGEVIIKKGTPVDGGTLDTAASAGEYIQTQLKSL